MLNRKSRAVQSVNISTVDEINYKSLYIITLLSIKQMAILHVFLCGIMKGIFMMFSRSLREYFDGTNTYEHVHKALNTLCGSKLRHHGNLCQEKWVMKERMDEGKDRSTEIQYNRDRRREGGGREAEKTSCPKGRNTEKTPTQ